MMKEPYKEYEFLKELASKIKDFSTNSKAVCKDSCFVAIKGKVFDGHDFINEAIHNGANYIIYESSSDKKYEIDSSSIHSYAVGSSRVAYSLLSSFFYKYQPNNLVAVTGTSGKSSVVALYRQLLQLMGMSAGSIGTIGAEGFDAKEEVVSLTTPDSKIFFSILSKSKQQNIEYLAFEASSHGLSQQRILGAKIHAAAFTNLSHDHLDYHENFENYLQAKSLIFEELLPEKGCAVINADIPEYKKLEEICQRRSQKIIDFGYKAEKLKLLEVKTKEDCSFVRLKWCDVEYGLNVSLVGHFQIENLLCATGLILSHGFAIEEIIKHYSKLKPVRGRLEKILPNMNIFVDYAHKPDALEKVLINLRYCCKGKLILVFGCGGNRDKLKRPIMGRIADKFADLVVITDDNPRDEDPNSIREEIIAECSDAVSIGNRKEAINFAITQMEKNDVLLIAGKGHEEYQIIAGKKYYYSDTDVVKDILGVDRKK